MRSSQRIQYHVYGKLLYAIDDPYLLRVVQIHLKFEHFFEIISILFISKKSVQYHCRWNLNQLRSSWKLLNAIDDPYFVRVVQNFRIRTFLWNHLYISHLKEICPNHCRSNLNQLIKLKITQLNSAFHAL